MTSDETLNPMERWITEVCTALGLDPSAVDMTALLDVARDAAHAVARPAAPITTFLVGLAAGSQGGGRDAVRSAASRVQQLCAQREAATPGPAHPAGRDS